VICHSRSCRTSFGSAGRGRPEQPLQTNATAVSSIHQTYSTATAFWQTEQSFFGGRRFPGSA
jgi:hypothetical protein